MLATAARTPVEVWVEVRSRSRPSSSSQRACTPRPSSGDDSERSMAKSSSRTWGAAAMAAAASPSSWVVTAATLPGTSSCTSRSPARAASRPTTAGSGS